MSENGITAVVDATHPFAATMTAHAAHACADLTLPHLVLARPAWDPGHAIVVASDTEAADTVARNGYSRVFLTTGRSGLAPFTDSDAWFLIRVVTPPDPGLLPRRHEVLLSRGPYTYDDEYKILRDNRIEVLVTKNSGGELTAAKLDAADKLGVPVVMIARPPLPAGVRTVSTVDEAVDWVGRSRIKSQPMIQATSSPRLAYAEPATGTPTLAEWPVRTRFGARRVR